MKIKVIDNISSDKKVTLKSDEVNIDNGASINRFHRTQNIKEYSDTDGIVYFYDEETDSYISSEKGTTFYNKLADNKENRIQEVTSTIKDSIKGEDYKIYIAKKSADKISIENPTEDELAAKKNLYTLNGKLSSQDSNLAVALGSRNSKSFDVLGETFDDNLLSDTFTETLKAEQTTQQDFLADLGNAIGDSFASSTENYFKNYEAIGNLFNPDFYTGQGKFADTKQVQKAYGKLQILRNNASSGIKDLTSQTANFKTKSLNPSVNMLGDMSANLRGPLATTAYFSELAIKESTSTWGKVGITAVNTLSGAGNQLISEMGLGLAIDAANGIIKGGVSAANADYAGQGFFGAVGTGVNEFFSGWNEVLSPGILTIDEVLFLNGVNSSNIYTSKPGLVIKYPNSTASELASRHMFSNPKELKAKRQTSYARLNIGELRYYVLYEHDDTRNLANLLQSEKSTDGSYGLPFYPEKERYKFDAVNKKWVVEGGNDPNARFGVLNGNTEITAMIKWLSQKNSSFKDLGHIYIKLNPLAAGITDPKKTVEPLTIPFEFTPIITENPNTAKYQSESLLARIGAWHMYTGTDLGGITLTTTYIPLSPDNVDEIEAEKMNIRQLGLDNWQYFWTQGTIDKYELLYRSLVFPTITENNIIKPPVIQIVLGKQNDSSIDNFFKHPLATAYDSWEETTDNKNKNTKFERSKDDKYFAYTKSFNNNKNFDRLKSYIVTSCQISPIDENGYYNMYGAYTADYNDVTKSYGKRNLSFERTKDADVAEKGIVTSRGFKVTIQCIEIKENIMDIYPDFKCFYDSYKMTDGFTIRLDNNATSISKEQIRQQAESGLFNLTEGSAEKLKNSLERAAAKINYIGKIKKDYLPTALKISRLVFDNGNGYDADNYFDFGYTEGYPPESELENNKELYNKEPINSTSYKSGRAGVPNGPTIIEANQDDISSAENSYYGLQNMYDSYGSMLKLTDDNNEFKLEYLKNNFSDSDSSTRKSLGEMLKEIQALPYDKDKKANINKHFFSNKQTNNVILQGLGLSKGLSTNLKQCYEELKTEMSSCNQIIENDKEKCNLIIPLKENYDFKGMDAYDYGNIKNFEEAFKDMGFSISKTYSDVNKQGITIKSGEMSYDKSKEEEQLKYTGEVLPLSTRLLSSFNHEGTISSFVSKAETLLNSEIGITKFSITGIDKTFKSISKINAAKKIIEAYEIASKNNLNVIQKQDGKFKGVSVSPGKNYSSTLNSTTNVMLLISTEREVSVPGEPKEDGTPAEEQKVTFKIDYKIPLYFAYSISTIDVNTSYLDGTKYKVEATHEDLINNTKYTLKQEIKDFAKALKKDKDIEKDNAMDSLITKMDEVTENSPESTFIEAAKTAQTICSISKNSDIVLGYIGGKISDRTFGGNNDISEPIWDFKTKWNHLKILEKYKIDNVSYSDSAKAYVQGNGKNNVTSENWNNCIKDIKNKNQCNNEYDTVPGIVNDINDIIVAENVSENQRKRQGLLNQVAANSN